MSRLVKKQVKTEKQERTFVHYFTVYTIFSTPKKKHQVEHMKCNNYLLFLEHHLKTMPFASQWWLLLYSACAADTELSVSRPAVTMVWKETFTALANSHTWQQDPEAKWHYIVKWWSNATRRKWMLLWPQGRDNTLFHTLGTEVIFFKVWCNYCQHVLT